jgi:hypothetical protein
VKRVDQAGGRDDRGAVLVVMEHRNVHPLPQRLLDHEAFGGLDVFQVDAAEARLEQLDTVDEGVDILGLHLEVDRIDIGEALEEDGLALHHRLGRKRAEIAEPQDRRAVRDHGDQVALGGIVIGGRRILGDRQHGHGHAGRIGQRQVALRRHRLGRDDFDFSRPALGVIEQRLALRKLDVRFLRHSSLQIASPLGGPFRRRNVPNATDSHASSTDRHGSTRPNVRKSAQPAFSPGKCRAGVLIAYRVPLGRKPCPPQLPPL